MEIVAPAPAPAAQEEVYGPVDLEKVPQQEGDAQDCPQAKPNEIVVCAPVDNEKYRLRELSPAPHSKTFNEGVVDALSVTRGNTTVGLIAPGQVGIKIKF
jgi:hypothetical protein